ncbi:hypothetical protein SK128_007180 [Halocaridina rubra]|uniref:Uncharacterized protein n=1 Tax=Halocaridina rubra TaxID=373956 RepID=A0AAN8ZSS0_HALRR
MAQRVQFHLETVKSVCETEKLFATTLQCFRVLSDGQSYTPTVCEVIDPQSNQNSEIQVPKLATMPRVRSDNTIMTEVKCYH